ncbi:tyrosine aminotransferase-like [Clytia hemisphaerica]
MELCNGHSRKRKWVVQSSDMAKRTVNPIRRIVDNMKIEPNPNLSTISLSIGDPTIFGNLLPHPNILKAIEESLRSHKNNGYAPAVGQTQARKAIAEYMSVPGAPLTEKDIIITSACSGAIEICLSALANAGDNIVCPRPGFSLYQTIGVSNALDVRFYNLLPEKEWEVDLNNLESQIDEKTKCILVTNPSNPCGSVYSRKHLIDILEVAERHKIPILADEIYAYSVFSGETFYPLASLTTTVPILSCCAISKRFLVPGWRLGWIQIHDRNDVLAEVRKGLYDLATRILGANSVTQGALPKILSETPKEWFDENLRYIEDNAKLAMDRLSKVNGLEPIQPRGAMYMMVGIDTEVLGTIESDIHFTEQLLANKSVFCLPGTCFKYPNFFRIVLTVPPHMIQEACSRIKEFCEEVIAIS